MRFFIALALSSLATTLAYQVIQPNAAVGWSSEGGQLLTWERADTDPLNFTVVLTNVDRSVFPDGDQVLAAQVDGNLKQVYLNPPAGGWPTGVAFRVNLAQDTDNLNSLYAQSAQFEIKPPNITSSSSTRASTASFTRPPPTTTAASTIPVTTPASVPSPSAAGSVGGDTPLNAGTRAFSVHAGLAPLFAAMCLFLA
ncbi:putative ser-Thr-rich glycosyl-phosphatidyl-inositol-anchored membrane family protein [Lyophyllum shimeji]|uniref:Ser-Thr-rich glycosyl-phosphatidyl-inositol-anchored membrane family protein n=1 Tax=Lyophyllum shimeji TaxID=47721 RepID=A0A9P3PEH2_LYOSH|nr:putative ser-Thr-rich glycosyl-phosphatidyl-inositol-anchored membrane family protein [Lyophyllum shimeji]